jgi:tetratricopeptide (TPR) repeat protein
VIEAEGEAQWRRYEEIERLVFRTIGRAHEDDSAGARLEQPSGLEDPELAPYLSAERSLWKVDYERAARIFADLHRDDPRSPLATAGLVFLLMAGSERIAALTDIAARWPRLQRPRFYAGGSHIADGRYAEAVEVLQRCTVLAPEDPLAWLHLSAARLGAGDLRGAVDAAEDALRAGRGSFVARRSAAHLLYRAGRKRRAFRVAFETARRTPGPRAWLLPLTLPLQISRRLWLVAVVIASVLLGLGKSPGPEFRWWALALGFGLGALMLAADFSSDNPGQRQRFRRFARKRERLRDELGLAGRPGSDPGRVR